MATEEHDITTTDPSPVEPGGPEAKAASSRAGGATPASPNGRSAPSSAGAQPPPRLAEGVELIGEFEDSGFKEAPFIARRADGQVVQLAPMLFMLAEQIDGRRDYEEIADGFSDAIERRVQAGDAQLLIEEQLRPLGVVAPADGEDVELGKVDPLLALKFRAAVVPDRAVRGLTSIFRPLFLPPVMVVAVLAMLGLDGWLFFVHGVSQSLRHTLYQPLLMLMLIGGVVLATAWHEMGHATAVRYGGAEPGVMGVGIYIVWPAFYTDITDAYRLGKWGRLRADIGGMYFNAIFALLIGGLYAATGFEPLLLLIVLQNFAILQQSLPFLRLDGYYILSDLTGVPDIFLRIRSVLASFVPGRPADERVTALKGWVRIVVSGYVVLVVLFFLVTILALLINLPRMVATGYDSAAL
ncbi:MAG: putative peptide zinc metalloprotease protein, partial [Solirubrobacteraceae bacterium]|nr:putative peptide zinc metalloprotease protein [Solirubrobacteraceae bacterium]